MLKKLIILISLVSTSLLFAQLEEKQLTVGDTPPDFTAMTVDGKPFKLSEHKGKYILLNFWGTWCMPCINEIPDLREIQALYGDKDLEIVSISAERKGKDIKSFVDSAGMKWTNISELLGDDSKNTVTNLYGVGMFPSNYLIDKNGKIAVFPLSFWKDSAGKIKMTMFQSTFLYSTLVKYLGEPKNAAEAFAQSKGTVFSVVQENAKSVAIAGSFNRWGAKPMFKVNGKWACKVDLAPGTYQYKYIVDGTWIVDPANTNIVDDGFGNKNSQIVIK